MDNIPVRSFIGNLVENFNVSKIIVVFIILLFINVFFSLVQKALQCVNKTKLKLMAESGNEKAEKVIDFTEEQYKFNYTCCIIRDFCTLLAGTYLMIYLSGYLAIVLENYIARYSGFIAGLIVSIVLVFIILVPGRLYPQSLAKRHAEEISLKTISLIKAISFITMPFVFLNKKTVKLLLKIGRQDLENVNDTFSEEEVMDLLETGQESGALKEEGRKMIDSIFAFDDKLAYEIMTPRTNVFAINIEDDTDEYMDELMELTYSRIPVYRDDTDNIIGILHIKDFLKEAHVKGFDNVDILDILREPCFVPETKNIDSLFFELQKTKQHIAILIDEYGGFAGIVTLEDIIEEVMGEIDDEYDEEETEIIKIRDNVYNVSGFMDLDDLNEELGLDIKSDNSETIGGFIMEILGEIPDEDSIASRTVNYHNCIFNVISVKDRRIEKIELTIDSQEE